MVTAPNRGARFVVALSLAAGIAALGCVLPLAPEFVEEKPAAPIAIDVRPALGTVITDTNALFDVTVQDPNSYDTLYARWLIDYPPYNKDISRWQPVAALPSRGAEVANQHNIKFQPNCVAHGISPTISQHRLMLVVSDRPFVDDARPAGANTRLDETPADAFAIRLFWTFAKDCR